MKRLSFLLFIIILLTTVVTYASNDKSENRVKYLNSVKIDNQEIKSNSNDLFDITSDIVYSTDTQQILISGKSIEGCEISIYNNEKPKGFTTNDLSEKLIVGNSNLFAKTIELNKGDNFILIVGKIDNKVQIVIFKTKLIEKSKQSDLKKAMGKIIDNILNIFNNK
ncbi:hypothetical protein ACAG39_07805 [Caldicellulosiruptoraceae bacterium PP1]